MSGTSKAIEMLAQEKHRQALERLHRALAPQGDGRFPDPSRIILARIAEEEARREWLQLMTETLLSEATRKASRRARA